MSCKGSMGKTPPRNYIFDNAFYKDILVKEKGTKFTREECRDLIESCNKIIADCIRTQTDGFKLPFGMGYLSVTTFTPPNPPVDKYQSQKLGKVVYHLNLHTFGKACRVAWYKVGRVTRSKYPDVYKFDVYQTLARSVSKSFRDGIQYCRWTMQEFKEKGRLENLYNKRFRKEQHIENVEN